MTTELQRNLLTPKLVAIVFGIDVFIVLFAALAAFGLQRLHPAVALGGGAALIVVCLLAAAMVRRRLAVSIAIGWVLHVGFIVSGLLLMPMYLIGGGAMILWVWCLWRGAKSDRSPAPNSLTGEPA